MRFEDDFKIETSMELSPWPRLFSHESKVRNLNYHSNVAILDRVYAKLHRNASFEIRNSNDGPEVFSSYAFLKSRNEIAVWMPWPLNCDLGGGVTWPSNHFRLYTTPCICTEAQAMRAPCMFDWQGTHTFFSRFGMLNPKFGLSCVHCVIQISQLLLSCVHCVIQIAQFERSWFKLCTLLSCENSPSVHAYINEPLHLRWYEQR